MNDMKLCYEMPIREAEKLFFSELPSKVAKAKAICATCHMSKACLEMALQNNEEYGIFGGMTPEERKVMA